MVASSFATKSPQTARHNRKQERGPNSGADDNADFRALGELVPLAFGRFSRCSSIGGATTPFAAGHRAVPRDKVFVERCWNVIHHSVQLWFQSELNNKLTVY